MSHRRESGTAVDREVVIDVEIDVKMPADSPASATDIAAARRAVGPSASSWPAVAEKWGRRLCSSGAVGVPVSEPACAPLQDLTCSDRLDTQYCPARGVREFHPRSGCGAVFVFAGHGQGLGAVGDLELGWIDRSGGGCSGHAGRGCPELDHPPPAVRLTPLQDRCSAP